jgi:hypothetical protein
VQQLVRTYVRSAQGPTFECSARSRIEASCVSRKITGKHGTGWRGQPNQSTSLSDLLILQD